VLSNFGVDTCAPADRRTIAEAVLTGANRSDAGKRLADTFLLSPSQQAILDARLRLSDGDATILPGAIELLASAATHSWRVIAATNAAAWVPTLPTGLAERIPTVVSSSDTGLLKQDEAFWSALCRTHDVDPLCCLVLGDDYEADVVAPRRAGLLSLMVDSASISLQAVAQWISDASTRPCSAMALVAGIPAPWGGRDVLDAPHLEPLLRSVTRQRVRVHGLGDASPYPATIVRRRDRPPAIVPDQLMDELPRLAWLSLRAENRSDRPPSDLAESLRRLGLSMDHFSARDRRHMISLVHEARDSRVRTARINSIIEHVKGLRLPPRE